MNRPGKIVCVGRNYREHAKELGNDVPTAPLLFLKPPSAVIAPEVPIVMPKASQRVDFEGEVGVVIGTTLRHATPAQCTAGIRGVVALNDVTARDLQKSDGQWTRAKGFDTAARRDHRGDAGEWRGEAACELGGDGLLHSGAALVHLAHHDA